jgi:siderophore synthetase component
MGDPPVNREHELAAAVIGTLLREDYGGLSRRVRRAPGGPVLDLPGPGGLPRVVPLDPDGFLADFRVAPGAPPLTIEDVRTAVAVISDPRDAGGVAAFGEECREALAALDLRDRCLRDRHVPAGGPDGVAPSGPVGALGPAGAVDYDALAAALPHPAYPTSAARLGLSGADALRYAPEYRPEFELNWVAIPRTALVRAGHERPPWWPGPAEVGLPASLAGTHELLPVHPVTARDALARALGEAGLEAAVAAPGTALPVRPTLSVRTVAVSGYPRTHLKLPLPVSSLGLRNRRAIAPATLADGALVHQILATVIRGDAALGGLTLTDDRSYAHAGHRFLGYLRRLLPEGLDQCQLVPVAALLAPAGPDGRLVIDDLAGGPVAALAGAYFDLLFRVSVRLFVRYGIALEAHQQNAAVVTSGHGDMRLLVKDFDGALIHPGRLAAALGPGAPGPSQFADQRLLTGSDDELADVFITITVHLCAGAIAFGLAERGRAPLADLLALVRRSLTRALDAYPGDPAAALLRARVLDAPRLPGKAMVTAGTLTDSSRTGARDINKFIGTTGPNYLRVPGSIA